MDILELFSDKFGIELFFIALKIVYYITSSKTSNLNLKYFYYFVQVPFPDQPRWYIKRYWKILGIEMSFQGNLPC